MMKSESDSKTTHWPGLPRGGADSRRDGIDLAIDTHSITIGEAEAMMEHGLSMWRIGAALYHHLLRDRNV